MKVEIELPTENITEEIILTKALQKIAKNLTKENIVFLAEMSERPNVNKSLEAKKGMIKAFI